MTTHWCYGEAFKDAMRQKVGDHLDASRKDYASNLFNAFRDVMTGQAMPETNDSTRMQESLQK